MEFLELAEGRRFGPDVILGEPHKGRPSQQSMPFRWGGFTTVYQDILIGHDFVRVTTALADLATRIVVLNPNLETLAERDANRAKKSKRASV